MSHTLVNAPSLPPAAEQQGTPLDHESFSIFKLRGGSEPGTVYDVYGKDHDPELYSKFKYSGAAEAAYYGGLLADAVKTFYGDDIEEVRDTYVAASAFRNVPTAAFHAVRYMMRELAMDGLTPKGLFHIDRGQVRDVDYATLDDVAREESVRTRGVVVPDKAARAIRGGMALVIDDLSATGKTSEESLRAVRQVGVERLVLGHIAILAPEAVADPSIESAINQAYVRGVPDLASVLTDTSTLNARTCKYILREGTPSEITELVNVLPPAASETILDAIVADEYHTISPKYAAAYQVFLGAVRSRREEQ